MCWCLMWTGRGHSWFVVFFCITSELNSKTETQIIIRPHNTRVLCNIVILLTLSALNLKTNAWPMLLPSCYFPYPSCFCPNAHLTCAVLGLPFFLWLCCCPQLSHMPPKWSFCFFIDLFVSHSWKGTIFSPTWLPASTSRCLRSSAKPSSLPTWPSTLATASS